MIFHLSAGTKRIREQLNDEPTAGVVSSRAVDDLPVVNDDSSGADDHIRAISDDSFFIVSYIRGHNSR